MKVKVYWIFLACGLVAGLALRENANAALADSSLSASKSQAKPLSVKVSLVKCSKTTGGVYRKGPPVLPVCSPTGGRFQILSQCKEKFDHRTCKVVLKRTSKTGNYPLKLSKGTYHFVWDLTSPELRRQGPCSLDADSVYDFDVQSDKQEVILRLNQHCSVP